MQKGVPVGQISQPQGNRPAQNAWPSTHQYPTKKISTFLDEFVYGFPSNGLSTSSSKWWSSDSKDEGGATTQGESTGKKDENRETNKDSNELKPMSIAGKHDAGMEDSAAATTPCAELCSLRRKTAEYGCKSLKSGQPILHKSYNLTKRQKLVLQQVFKSSMPDEWKGC